LLIIDWVGRERRGRLALPIKKICLIKNGQFDSMIEQLFHEFFFSDYSKL
jgi:hypothetical protein